MTKRTSVNKFFLYRKTNQVFSKWKFFYARYASKLAFFKKGFYMENSISMSQSAVNRTKDLTKMVFWLLDLTEQGYSSKLTQDKRNINFEWELVKGEGKFVELYGNIIYSNKEKIRYNFLKQHIKSSIIDFFWQKHDIMLSDNDIKEITLEDTLNNKKKVLKVQMSDALNSKFKYSKNNMIHSSFKKDMLLFKNKSSVVDFNLPVDYKRLDLLRNNSSLTSYDEIDLYINASGYTKNTGTSDVNVFKQLVMSGHQTGRYKLLPTFVAELDDPTLMMLGQGFHNYFKTRNSKEDVLLKSFLMFSKQFMPVDGMKMLKYYDNTSTHTNTSVFHNYFKNSENYITKQHHIRGYNMTSSIDYVEYNFLEPLSAKLSLNTRHNINDLYKLYNIFRKIHTQLLYHKAFSTYKDFDSFLQSIAHNVDVSVVLKSGFMLDNYKDINKTIQKFFSLTAKKNYFFTNYYTRLYTMHDLFLDKWNKKIKQLFLLRVDLASNWGYYLDKHVSQDLEEGLSKKSSPYTMEYIYRSYFENVRHPTIIHPAQRPYKWVSIPILQHSPFFYWMTNIRSNWFHIFDQTLGLFNLLRKDNKQSNSNKLEQDLSKLFSKLMILRYFDKNDFLYNNVLKFLHSRKFFRQYFSQHRTTYFNLSLFLDASLSFKEGGHSLVFDNKHGMSYKELIGNINAAIPSHFYNQLPEIDAFSIFKYHDFWNYGSSRFFEADWLTESQSFNLSRVPFLSKAGLTPDHFSFFSFFSRDFFEQTIAYQSWMKFRTFETPYMEEKSWREFTFLHQPLINLTVDITLSKYKADLLNLMELGFHDIVFEKDIFYKSHYLFQQPKLRDIFDFQEFTAPFFFFDSERAAFGNVPQRLPFEYVSSFGIPLLDKHWMVRDYLSSDVDRDLDRGEWYVRANKSHRFDGRNTWRKDRMVHKFIYDNSNEKALIEKDMYIFMLTSIKGSKLYDDNVYELKNKRNPETPKVYGILYTSISSIKAKKADTEAEVNDDQNKELLLSQFDKLHVFYLKSWFYVLIKHMFGHTYFDHMSNNFITMFSKNKFMRNNMHHAFVNQFMSSLFMFSKFYKIISQTLLLQQLNYTFVFKRWKSSFLINSLSEIALYFKLIFFIFKNKN